MRRADRTFLLIASAAVLGAAAFLSSLSAQSMSGHRASLPREGHPQEPPRAAIDFWSAGEDAESVAALLDKLSDEEILGQIFMMAYPGTEPPPLLYRWIERRALGGIKVFGWNAEDTEVLARAIQNIQDAASRTGHRIPPFIATDQEGGWIRHVKGATSVTPGNMAIGASALPRDAYRSAYLIGRELVALGITMNFAPTVDLALKPRSTIIGPRAFSADPASAAVLSAAYVRGMEDAGVLPTAKHFPGHGDTELDSHGILPVLQVDEGTLWERDLLPYRMLVAEGLPGIMSGHLAFPRITGDRTPASLSPHFITGILRERMGFEGLVVTDDLFMTGAAVPGGFPEVCVRAVMAGNDIIMISKILDFSDEAWVRLLREYRSNPAFRTRVRQSALRVLRAKQSYLKRKGPAGVEPRPDRASLLQSPEARSFFLNQAYRSATVLEDVGLPLKPGTGRILLAGPFSDFFAEGTARYPGADTFRFSYQPDPETLALELEALRTRSRGARAVVVCVANPAGAAFARGASRSGVPVYLVSVFSPVYALDAGPVSGGVAVYNASRESYTAAFAVLSGALEGRGILPIPRTP